MTDPEISQLTDLLSLLQDAVEERDWQRVSDGAEWLELAIERARKDLAEEKDEAVGYKIQAGDGASGSAYGNSSVAVDG